MYKTKIDRYRKCFSLYHEVSICTNNIFVFIDIITLLVGKTVLN
jgi:hypothetical protein